MQKNTHGCQGDGLGEGIVREFGMDTYTWLYLKWITSKDLLSSTENTVQCYVAVWVGGEPGGERTRVCVAESLCCPRETITTLLIGNVK